MNRLAKHPAALALAIVVGAAGVSGTALAAVDAGKVIASRIDGFKKMGGAFKTINDTLKTDAPDKAVIAAQAKIVAQQAKQVGKWFPAGSGPESGQKTRAKAEIWTDAAGYASAVKALEVEAAKLETVARGGDVDAIKAQVKALNDRKSRFEKRADVTKTLLEQALLIAGLDKVQRPAATLSLAKRPAKVLVETESDIPARFWDDGEPVLNGTRLKEELQAREEKFTVLIEASAESLDLAVEEFAQAFPDTENLGILAERVRAYQALPVPASVEDKTSPEAAVAMAQQQARNESLALLRRDYVGVAGAVLTQPGRGLNIRVA